ncbi:MAG: RDD family protein [Rhodocyclaceae bacterium]|nr:RDD family protein [Rhodocyclaceae bacterium]
MFASSKGSAGEAAPSIRRRLASLLYESLLLLGVLSVAFMIPHLALGLLMHWTAPGPLLLLHVFLVLGGYFLWYWNHGGQTLAMQTWRICVESAGGGRPTSSRLVLRYLLSWPSLLFYGAGIWWAFLDRDRQFLHDRLAGTRIAFKHPPP